VKKIIICNTYYQFIIASHLTFTSFKGDSVDLILTDQSNNMNLLFERITKTKLCPFDKVYYLETKYFNSHKKGVKYLHDIYNTAFHCKLFDQIDYKGIEEVIFYNLDYSTMSIVDKSVKKNPNVAVSRFEEGILSYNHTFRYFRLNLILLLRKLLKRKNLEKGKNYCFFPEFFERENEIIKIPSINDDVFRLKQLFDVCFDLQFTEKSYEYKYIFFSSVYDFEGGDSIGEFQAINRIADLVGKQNILIKKHPRDTRKIYEENGFNVDINSSVPWEVLQFNIDLKDKVLLTVNSGSVLSTSLLFGSNVQAYYVYGCCDISHNELAKESISEIKKLLTSDMFIKKAPNIKIMKDINEL
jgi:hypothetical protein